MTCRLPFLKNSLIRVLLMVIVFYCAANVIAQERLWPDGTVMDEWFVDTVKVDANKLGRRFVITDYGVRRDSSVVQTVQIQSVIDTAYAEGGGVVVVPKGTFLSGSLFFRPGTHLHIEDGGKLKGSDRIIDFKITKTRIEGETCRYFSALVNADGVDGFTITGNGTLDGNGLKYWQEFWIRRQWNPQCTNKDAQRPRLVYISNSENVTVQDVRMVNSPFWTNHIYRCSRVKFLDCYIYAPTENIFAPEPRRGAPSSDAIDIDACHDVLVSGCYMHVNDDAVVLKGGKGTFADKDPDNGPCHEILIQNCRYGKVHGCLTLGSESVHDRNIVIRDCHAEAANRVLWLKMRPDTPQHYEYVEVDGMTGRCGSFIVVRPWTQFFNLQKRADMPLSQCNNITVKNIKMECANFFDVGKSDKYRLKDFTFTDIDVVDKAKSINMEVVENMKMDNVRINGKSF